MKIIKKIEKHWNGNIVDSTSLLVLWVVFFAWLGLVAYGLCVTLKMD